ncbi:MAG TPA: hypothetical protein PKM40_05295, partial [Bacteroidia bacterium]|nr:hypothetical protein [Bacteroidia bacterium]
MKKMLVHKSQVWLFTTLTLVVCYSSAYSQLNNTWLIGNQPLTTVLKARMVFDSTNYVLTQENRKMTFEGTEATISD